jgi:hypothetical protein
VAHQIDRRTFLKMVPASAVLATSASSFGEVATTAPVAASQLQPIQLLKPEKEGGKSVLAALWERKTTRNISAKPLPPQMLANLVWAAFGVNRPRDASGRVWRTAASASNSQEIDVYVVLPEGVYLYEAVPHRLTPVADGDHRSEVGGHGRQNAAAIAPVNLIYVVDLAKYAGGKPQEPGLKDTDIQKSYYYVDTGLIAGNVYLFAASQGLAAWFHNCNKPALAETLKVRPEQRVLYAHTVGYPA